MWPSPSLFPLSLPSHFWFQSISVITALEILISTTLVSLVSRRKKIIQIMCRRIQSQQFVGKMSYNSTVIIKWIIHWRILSWQFYFCVPMQNKRFQMVTPVPRISMHNKLPSSWHLLITLHNSCTSCSPVNDEGLNLNSKLCLSTWGSIN